MSETGPHRDCRAELTALELFWHQCRTAEGLATRRLITPFTLRPWLGHICVYQQIEDGADFRIKLDGTAVVELTGEDWTRRRVSEVDGRFGTRLLADCRETCARGEPVLSFSSLLFQKKWVVYHRLLLPVSSKGEGYDQIFNAMYPAEA